MTLEVAWFHEDDYCVREVLPLGNLAWCSAQNWNMLGFADAHAIRAEGRIVGYSDMYVRDPVPEPLATLSIPLDVFAEVMGRTLARRDKVHTGPASGDGELCPNTLAFGGVFADHDDAGIIQHIWTPEPLLARGAADLDALIDLTPQYSLLFADWLAAWALPIDRAMPHRDAFFDVHRM